MLLVGSGQTDAEGERHGRLPGPVDPRGSEYGLGRVGDAGERDIGGIAVQRSGMRLQEFGQGPVRNPVAVGEATTLHHDRRG